MSLEKIVFIDRIEVFLDTSTISVRERTAVVENGEIIGTPENHRYLLLPDSDLSPFDARVRGIAAVVFTPEVVAAYQTKMEALKQAG